MTYQNNASRLLLPILRLWGVTQILSSIARLDTCGCFRVVSPSLSVKHQRCYNKPLSSIRTEGYIQSSDSVQIYDNLLNPEICLELHHLASDHSHQVGDDSTIFYRSCKNIDKNDVIISTNDKEQLSRLESAIDTILTKVCNDTSTRVVEYWTRQEYINMDTHCDIDEYLLQKRKVIHCPEWAHILYLFVQPNITAPTVIFPNKLKGWTIPPINEQNNINTNHVDLVVIPAVQGRVVRFIGSAMHAVPKPPHKWILSTTEEANVRMLQQEEEEDYNDNINHQIERSVILFNCWSNDSPPPIGLQTLDGFQSKIPDGIEIDDDTTDVDKDYTISSQVAVVIKKMDTLNDNWYQTKLHVGSEGDDDSLGTMRVRLMGNKYRRLHNKAVVKLTVNEDSFLQSLHEGIIPTYMQLYQLNDSTR